MPRVFGGVNEIIVVRAKRIFQDSKWPLETVMSLGSGLTGIYKRENSRPCHSLLHTVHSLVPKCEPARLET